MTTREKLENLIDYYIGKTGDDPINQVTNPDGNWRYHFPNGLVLTTDEAHIYMMGVIDGMRRIDSSI